MNGLATVHFMPHDLAVDAHSVTAYQLDDGPRKGATVVEVTDRHQQVIARTVTDAAGSREEVAELVLARSPLQRCAGWAIEPFGRRKRVAALVTLRVSSHAAPAEAFGMFGATA